MTIEQPIALRLADKLDEYHLASHHRQAAAELRRLHAENEALLEALKLARSIIGHPDDAHTQMIDAAQQALEAMNAPRDAQWQSKHTAAIIALRAALAQQAEPVAESCTWFQDGDSESGVYATSCRRYFDITDGTPEDNKMQWCCYCGKKLAQELITEDEDE